MMQSFAKRGLITFGIGAAAFVLSATQALAVPIVVMDTADTVAFDGPEDGIDSHYDLTFDLSGHANWGPFNAMLGSNPLTSVVLHIDLTPMDSGFDTDRLRVMTGADPVLSKIEDRLPTTHALAPDVDVNDGGNSVEDRVLKYTDLEIQLGPDYQVGQVASIDVELLDWYAEADLTNLLSVNGGILHIVSGDDSLIWNASLTVEIENITTQGNPLPTPEPASLILLGSGLVGLVGWRLRKDQHRG